MNRRRVDLDTGERIFEVLCKYLSESSARTVIARVEQARGVRASHLRFAEIPCFLAAIDAQARTWIERGKLGLLQGELQFELNVLISRHTDASSPVRDTVQVRGEWDINLARARGRQIAAALGASSTDVVRVMTLVSELARNIVLYTSGGRIELSPSHEPRALRVLATDEGPGIANLLDVLSGHYRSRTGLGRGLMGVKRLSDRFDIETGAGGTRVEAEVRFPKSQLA